MLTNISIYLFLYLFIYLVIICVFWKYVHIILCGVCDLWIYVWLLSCKAFGCNPCMESTVWMKFTWLIEGTILVR